MLAAALAYECMSLQKSVVHKIPDSFFQDTKVCRKQTPNHWVLVCSRHSAVFIPRAPCQQLCRTSGAPGAWLKEAPELGGPCAAAREPGQWGLTQAQLPPAGSRGQSPARICAEVSLHRIQSTPHTHNPNSVLPELLLCSTSGISVGYLHVQLHKLHGLHIQGSVILLHAELGKANGNFGLLPAGSRHLG